MKSTVSLKLSSLITAFALIAMLLMSGTLTVTHAAPVATDGRINLIPWVNSWGAIAVYCVNQFDQPGDNFTGGGIKILTDIGQKVFFAKEAIVTPARNKANQLNTEIFIWHQGHYYLFAQPGGYFRLASDPDVQGKTFIARWKDCFQVGAGPDPEVAPTASPTEEIFPCGLLDSICCGDIPAKGICF